VDLLAVNSRPDASSSSGEQFCWSTTVLFGWTAGTERSRSWTSLTTKRAATRADFEGFGDRLDASGLRYDLLPVTYREDGDDLLTDRQLEFLTVAGRMGYLEVPRECTLAEVADALDVDTSTVSETIRRGTGRVVHGFLLER
jgi:predicted DNA binding protein